MRCGSREDASSLHVWRRRVMPETTREGVVADGGNGQRVEKAEQQSNHGRRNTGFFTTVPHIRRLRRETHERTTIVVCRKGNSRRLGGMCRSRDRACPEPAIGAIRRVFTSRRGLTHPTILTRDTGDSASGHAVGKVPRTAPVFITAVA